MTLLTYNAVKETSTSTGVGAFALAGAVTGFQTFASKVANGASVPYVIRAQGSALWECGICVYNSGPNTITRSAGNVDDGSSGPGVLVNFTANTWVVFIDITADQIVQASNNGSEFNAAAFRTSLGLGSAALKSTAFFATAVDGVTLDEGGAGGSTEIAPGGVGTTQLAANAVTSAKMSNVGPGVSGPIGSSTVTPVITIDGAGRVTALTSANISGGGGGLTYTNVTGTSQAMAVNTGYIANNASLVTLTLPATAAIGSVIPVVGNGAGGWKIAQNAGQNIMFGVADTTTGTGGSLASTNEADCVELVCTVANTTFVVRNSVGNVAVT